MQCLENQVNGCLKKEKHKNNTLLNFKHLNSLSLFDGLRHGEEDTVEQNGGHDEVIEVLVGREVDARPPHRRPRRPPEEGPGRREPVNVVLAKSFRHNTESL